MSSKSHNLLGVGLELILLMALTGCGDEPGNKNASAGQQGSSEQLSGRINIDGSSTVYPITDAVAREFRKNQPRVWVRVDLSGSGSGFERLCGGQIEIADASRPINAQETALARQNAIEFIELPVAFDGITVVVNEKNTWVDYLTVDELRKLWAPGSTVKTWQDLRAGWPDKAIDLCAQPPVSGTFDYFTTAICGQAGAIRKDYFTHEDGHVLGPYVAEHENGLGFFGFGWYVKFKAGLRAVPIAMGGRLPVAPNETTIRDGTYQPLARPIFIYVSQAAAARPEVQSFVHFYFAQAPARVKEVGYVALPEKVYQLALERFERRRTGSAFANGVQVGVSMEDLLQRENK